MNILQRFFSKISPFKKVRIIFTISTLRDKVRKYRINNSLTVTGSEAYHVKDFDINTSFSNPTFTDDPILWTMFRGKVRLPIPLFGNTLMPFKVLPDGYLTPNWNCKGKGKPLDYLFWIPLENKDDRI